MAEKKEKVPTTEDIVASMAELAKPMAALFMSFKEEGLSADDAATMVIKFFAMGAADGEQKVAGELDDLV